MITSPETYRKRTRFRAALLRWYDANRRDLPWRQHPPDPYRIWISEIMLQQTRVAAVIDYFERFTERFPDVGTLAAASEQDVLASWSGLGYYRRARMLHQAAKRIVNDFAGHIPRSAKDLLELPGVGPYTAAAIASIAFQEPRAVVDGNVERILLRIGGEKTPAALWVTAQSLLSQERPGDFNQAMMELGATVCLPRDPQCTRCPIRRWCVTKGEHATKPRAPRRRAVLSYALARRNGSIRLVQRRQDAALMAAMWELPTCTATGAPVFTLRHSITTTDYRVNIYMSPKSKLPGRWIPLSRINTLPLTGVARKALRKAQLV